jgi:hypothetical protein
VEGKDIAGALAGGLVATALMETLVAKGILSADERGTCSRRTIGNNTINAEQQGAAALLNPLLSHYRESLRQIVRRGTRIGRGCGARSPRAPV